MDKPLNECTLPKFLRRKAEHIMMFGWVQSTRMYLPTLSIDRAILQFVEHYSIDDDVEALRKAYTRMLKEMMEADRG